VSALGFKYGGGSGWGGQRVSPVPRPGEPWPWDVPAGDAPAGLRGQPASLGRGCSSRRSYSSVRLCWSLSPALSPHHGTSLGLRERADGLAWGEIQ